MNLREKMARTLVDSLKDEDNRGKIRLLNLLKEYSDELRGSLKNLIHLLDSSDHRIRYKTCELLKETGSDINEILDDIIRVLKKEEEIDVKTALITLLGNSKSEKTIPILKDLFENDPCDACRQAAIESIAHLGSEEILPILFKALKDSASNVRYAAANAFKWLQIDDKIEPLLKALNDNDAIVRASVAWSLGTIHNVDAIIEPMINALQNDDDEFVRYNLMKSMGEIRDDKFIPVLLENVKKDPEVKNRLKGIEILGEIGTKKAFEGLINLYKQANTMIIRNKINFAMRYADSESQSEFEKILAVEFEHKQETQHQKEIQALHNYRLNELQNILQNHKSMSVSLFAGLLKISSEQKIIDWINNLPTNLGLKILENPDYDSIIFTLHDDDKMLQEKANIILNLFSKEFEQNI